MSHGLAGPALRLTTTQYETIVAHCYDGLDDEACGLLIGPLFPSGEPTGRISEARPCRNADASAVTYTVDSRDMLAAMRAAEARGEEIVGVWHSHTHTDAYPSPTDVRQAVDPAWFYVIVSLRDVEPTMHAYRIRDGVIAEVPIELER
jgi:[CysO sulfur-carrier protein]-S-L-cysteine hydrolase